MCVCVCVCVCVMGEGGTWVQFDAACTMLSLFPPPLTPSSHSLFLPLPPPLPDHPLPLPLPFLLFPNPLPVFSPTSPSFLSTSPLFPSPHFPAFTPFCFSLFSVPSPYSQVVERLHLPTSSPRRWMCMLCNMLIWLPRSSRDGSRAVLKISSS